MLRRLRDEADTLAGELVLGHLCEAAQVRLTCQAFCCNARCAGDSAATRAMPCEHKEP